MAWVGLSDKVVRQIVKALGPHGPDALMVVFLVLAAGSAVGLGLNAIAVGVFALAMFMAYGWRKGRHERHLERMADAGVRKLEVETVKVREKHAQKLAELKANLPSVTGQASPKTPKGKQGSQR